MDIARTSTVAASWPLSDLRAQDVEEAGGKAGTLARAVRQGLPVPSGFVVPVHAPEDAETRRAWVVAARRLGARVHVRSSSPVEDGAAHAHAGAFATVGGVAPDDVPAAVDAVRASARRPGAPGHGEMAVLVQPTVAARVAGVAFTVDPRTGARHVVVEAVEGDGAALVGGLVSPQRLVVRPPGRLRRARVLAHPEGPVDAALLRRVVDLALRAETLLGAPADVEWAVDGVDRLWLLQARPVTATAPRPPRDEDPLWTRRFLGERWTEPATPLGWSVVQPALAERIVYPRTQARHLGASPLLRLVQGIPYVDARIFRHLLIKLPGLPPPRFLLELLPSQEAAAWSRRVAKAPDLPLVAALLAETVRDRRWARFALDPTDTPRAWQAFARDLRRALPGLAPPYADDTCRTAAVEAHLSLLSAYVGVHVSSLLFANLAWQRLGHALERALPGHDPQLLRALVACPASNHGVRQQEALAWVAQEALPEDLDALTGGRAPRAEVGRRLDAFLATYGHRARAGWELTSPRWHDDPAALVPLLRALRGAPAPHADDPGGAALATLIAHAPLLHLPGLLGLVWWTRRYLLLRENQRHVLDELQQSLHRALLDVGEALVRRGRLQAATDVTWLTWPEARRALRDPTPVTARVATRRAAHAAWRLAPPPPVVLAGDPPPDPAATVLVGQGVSHGQARGPVRIVHDLAAAARLRPGDVLVTHALEPAWAPLLGTVAAAVVELGGALSHGAVVARELGLPVVVDVVGAVERLRDGQSVAVDGDRGLVWLLSDPEEVKCDPDRADPRVLPARGTP